MLILDFTCLNCLLSVCKGPLDSVNALILVVCVMFSTFYGFGMLLTFRFVFIIQTDIGSASDHAVRKVRGRRVSTPDGLVSKPGGGSAAVTVEESVWSVSNVLMLCLLLALLLNGVLMANLLWASSPSPPSSFPAAYEGVDSAFDVQREQWRRAFVRRQQLLDGSYNPFMVFTNGDPIHQIPPADDGI